jgi:high-affinity nickel-transport protein
MDHPHAAPHPTTSWKPVLGLLAMVTVLHVAGWGLLGLSAGPGTGIGISAGILAYLLGLRHAFDADHVAAIDNTTRKLIADGQRPNSVGFFFSLGHSTVVFTASALIALGFATVGTQLADETSTLRQVGAAIGGLVSSGFLLALAGINLIVLIGVLRTFARMRTQPGSSTDVDTALASRGIMTRLTRPLARTIDKPWKMYPLGILFGLGFDTASSIALLGMAGTSAITGNSFWSVLALPIIFAAGMSLGDTADGVFMNRAYQWAFARPVRRAYYNIAVTAISVLAAITIAVPLLAGVLVHQFNATWPPLRVLAAIDLTNTGFVLVGLFALTWALSVAVWKFGRIEERWNEHLTSQAA